MHSASSITLNHLAYCYYVWCIIFSVLRIDLHSYYDVSFSYNLKEQMVLFSSQFNMICLNNSLSRISYIVWNMSIAKNNIYSILTRWSCYGSRTLMDNNSHNCCDNHHSSTAKAGLCYYSNWPICSIWCASRRYECLQSTAASHDPYLMESEE